MFAGDANDQRLNEVCQGKCEQERNGDEAEAITKPEQAKDCGEDEDVADGLDLPEVAGTPIPRGRSGSGRGVTNGTR